MVVLSMVLGAFSTTSFADTSLDGNSNSGGGTGTGNDPAYAHKFLAYPENQGYRVSIVNDKGERVANSVDIVNYVPKWLWGEGGIPTGNSNNEDENYAKGFSQYNDFIGWENRADIGGKKANFIYSCGIKTEEFSQATWNSSVVPYKDVGGYKINTWMYPKDIIEGGMERAYNQYATEKNAAGADIPLIDLKIPSVHIPLPSELDRGTKRFHPGGTGLKTLFETGVIDKKTGESMLNYATLFVNMRIPQFNNSGEVAGGSDYLFKFVDNSLQSLVGTKNSEGKTIAQSDIIAEKGYKLIIEPLYWYVPEVLTEDIDLINRRSSNGPHIRHMRFVCYGTVSYLAKYTEEALKNTQNFTDEDNSKMWVGPDWGGAGLGVTTLMIAKNDEKLGIKEPSQIGLPATGSAGNLYSIYDLAAGTRYKESGYSLHIYDSVLGNKQVISTSTYDKSKYPNSKGPAPEPPTQPEGEEYIKVGKDHIRNIVKFYADKNPDGSLVYTANYVRENTVSTINIEDEASGYTVAGYFTSSKLERPASQSVSYEDVKSRVPSGSLSGSSAKQITFTPETSDTTLYVKLVKTKNASLGDINVLNLYENELSYPYSLSAFRSNLEELYYSFPDKSYSGSCDHGYEEDDSWTDADGNEHSDSHWVSDIRNWSRSLSDSSYRIAMKNNFPYGNTSFIGASGVFNGREDGKVDTSDGEKSASISGFNTNILNPNWRFVYYRDKNQDKVTLYPEINTSKAVNELSLLGIGVGDYKSLASGRKENAGSGIFNNSFPLQYDYDGLDKELSWDSSGCSEHGDSGSYSGTESKSPSAINSVYSVADGLETAYYTGQANTGTTTPNSSDARFRFGLGSTPNEHLFDQVAKVNGGADNSFKFYPYVGMKYANIDGTEGKALVKSTNLSTVGGYTRIDVALYKSNPSAPELKLESELWNSHARSWAFMENESLSDKASVLPGGSLYTLKTSTESSDASDTWVGLHSYQVCIDDADLKKLADSNVLTKSKAEENLNSFYASARDNLGKYQVTQFIAPGFYKSLSDFYSSVISNGKGMALNGKFRSGTAFSDGTRSYTLSKDDKYYLKTDVAGSINPAYDSSRINVIDERGNNVYWYLTSDENGTVRVRNTAGVDKSISKTQGVSVLLSDTFISMLDSRTSVVTNFVNALDRNKGIDRNGHAWYNEGFGNVSTGTGGLMVVESFKAYRIGFGAGGNGIRGSVLDPKLSGYAKDSGDIFTFYTPDGEIDKSKVRTSAFFISPYVGGENSGVVSFIGELNGKTVQVGGAPNMMKSKLFYIPNATVMDLD